MIKELKAVDFDVELEPVFRQNGQMIPHAKVIVNKNINEPVNMATDKYMLIPNRETIIPLVEDYLHEGWVMSNRVGGRSSVRIEANGRRVFVEMFNPNKVINLPSKHNGKIERVFPRAVLANSYDRTTALKAQFSMLVEWCTNGATRPGADLMNFMGRKHSGIKFVQGGEYVEMGERFSDNFEKYVNTFRMLNEIAPSEERAMDAIHEVTVRNDTDVVQRIDAPLGRAIGWQVYQGITNYLSYDFKGGQSLFDLKQKNALKILEAQGE